MDRQPVVRVDGDTLDRLIGVVGLVFTALPWIARMLAGRKTVVHDLLTVNDAGRLRTYYLLRILRRGALSVQAADVVIPLARPLNDDVTYEGNGLKLASVEGEKALRIQAGSMLQPRWPYEVELPVGAARTELLSCDEQSGIRLVQMSDYLRRLGIVRRISGAVMALLVVAGLLAYLGWFPFPAPNSLLGCLALLAGIVGGVPGLLASRSLEAAGAWFALVVSP